jgi:hypothetical protein
LNLADTYAFTGTVTGTPTGLSHCQVFNKTSNQSVSSDTDTLITWSGESSKQSRLGSALASISSGVISFSQTGFYLLNVNITVEMQANSGHTRDLKCYFEKTTNNSSYSTQVEMMTSVPNTDGGEKNRGIINVSLLTDITDTTNHKLKVQIRAQSNGVNILGSSSLDNSNLHIMRISDT